MELPENSLNIIHRLFPETDTGHITSIDFGWTNQILVVNSKYVVKIPRYSHAARSVEKEMEITGKLNGRLPVGIPKYINRLYNKELVAAAYDFIEGAVFTTQPVEDGMEIIDPSKFINGNAGDSIAEQIGKILSSIHEVSTELVGVIIEKYVKDTWDSKIINWIGRSRKICKKAFLGSEMEKCCAFMNSLESEYSKLKFDQTFIHGDFGGWNMLFDPVELKFTAILDWADSRFGDPAKDFTELIYDFGSEFASKVLTYYSRKDDPGIIKRAEFYLKLSGFQDLEYGLEKKFEFFTERGKKAVLEELKNF